MSINGLPPQMWIDLVEHKYKLVGSILKKEQ